MRKPQILLLFVALALVAQSIASKTIELATSLGSTTKATNMMEEPNPPVWPDSVKVFRETDDPAAILKAIKPTEDPWMDEYNSFTADKHFVSDRTALLFAPGTYRNVSFQVGYYVQMAGLGYKPDAVKFVNGGPYVPALNKHLHKRTIIDEHGNKIQQSVGTCLDSFWRSMENLAIENSDLQWAVSQAAPLRRVHVINGDVYLHDGAAYASGGHFANSKIDNGMLLAGGQQQFLIRNVALGKGARGGAWSMVYAGCTGEVPEAGFEDDGATVTVVEEPRVRVEKPYISLQENGTKYQLRVPKAMLSGDISYTREPMFDGHYEDVRDFSRVRVVRDTDPVSSIQEALDEGKDVVLAPGIYSLKKTVELRKPGQVLLGLGLATLEAPRNGTPCVHVAPNLSGVRIAGIMLEATEKDASAADNNVKTALLEWGNTHMKDPGRKDDPGAMHDIFVRVGGATTGDRTKIAVDAMMRLHSGNVVGDNLWIWRADHAVLGKGEKANYPHISPIFWQSEQNEFRAEIGIEVTADDVSMYGLAVEHANQHQTVWSGENGSVVFYQCEFPYGVYKDFAENSFRGYLVKDHVQTHEVHAPGVYSNFRNDDVQTETAMNIPEKEGISVANPFIVKLDNQGGILSVINGKGGAAVGENTGTPVRLFTVEEDPIVATA